MQMLADAGIYVITDLATPSDSINRIDPQWTVDLYKRYTKVIDAFHGYSNVIGFFVGNEVSNRENNTAAMAYVKAAARDMKAYIGQKNYRRMAVGYSTDDDASVRDDVRKYVVCENEATRIDMMGYNIYEWCGDKTFESSGYANRTSEFKDYPVPVFFSEYGCIHPRPRNFDQVPVIYGPKMNNVWSGGIVYQYFQTTNNYGLVSVNGNKVQKQADFTSLSSQIQKVHPTGVNSASFSASTSAPACPTIDAGWHAASNLPPSPNAALCNCMTNTLSCVASDSLNNKDMGDIFNYICGAGSVHGSYCAGIHANATTGEYGAYSMCDARAQLSFVMNQYWKGNGKQASACDFKGKATKTKSSSPSGTCKGLLKQAGAKGTGTVTGGPNGGGSGSGGGGASASTSSGAASMVGVSGPVMVGVWPVWASFVTVVGVAAGMVML